MFFEITASFCTIEATAITSYGVRPTFCALAASPTEAADPVESIYHLDQQLRVRLAGHHLVGTRSPDQPIEADRAWG